MAGLEDDQSISKWEAHVLERGGMRNTWLRGRENVHKRYLVHVAGYNLGVLMRALFDAGTPREAAAVARKLITILNAILREDAKRARFYLCDLRAGRQHPQPNGTPVEDPDGNVIQPIPGAAPAVLRSLTELMF